MTSTITWTLILTLCDFYPCRLVVYTGFLSQKECRVAGTLETKKAPGSTFSCVIEEKRPQPKKEINNALFNL